MCLSSAVEFNKMATLTSLIKSRTSTFSTFNFQANAHVWKTGMQRIKFLPRLLAASPTRSIYTLDSVSNFMKRAQLVQAPESLVTATRCINTRSKRSKLGKRKTCKAVAKRFKRTGNGNLKYWRPGKSANMMQKGPKLSRQLRKSVLCNKQQLKLLNKMLNGW